MENNIQQTQSSKIKIDIISDVVCPWCIVGYKNLTQAIKELGVEDRVEIEWQPFELNPDMPSEGEDLQAHLARKYGSTPQSSAEARAMLTQRGKDVGFTFNYFEGMKIVNTRDVHVLLDYAKDFNLQTELKLRLFSAFFTEQKDVSNREVLENELKVVGLNVTEAMTRLDDEEAIRTIQNKESDWQRMGVSSVPTVVINRSNGISGAHPVDGFKQFITSFL